LEFNFSAQEQQLADTVKGIADERLAPIADEADESNIVSPEVVRILAEEGIFGYVVPPEHGGRGIKVVNLCIIREGLAMVCSQADTNFAMQGLGSYPITLGGTDEQKRRYLPGIVTGDRLSTLAMTEPGRGSDVLGMTTTAVRDGNSWVLNGEKRFISQVGEANTYVVIAKTDPEGGSRALSAFVVEKGTPGFDDSHKVELMLAHSIGAPRFRDCRIPAENLLGEAGQGLRLALGTLGIFRTTVGAAAVGMAQAAFDAALRYADQRQAFGKRLRDFQDIQFKLADMAVSLEAARLLVYRAAWLNDTGAATVKDASFAKLYGTETATRVIDTALQIHGASGLELGNRVQRLFREVRAMTIYEGTSEIQRQTIARELYEQR
jgi:acyl-CoA dehydrogenase